nr:hypothetical protein [Tanacetum cinerariifolium]
MSKTRADYGSGIARPKIDDKDSFELKGQFLKELRDNTFSGVSVSVMPLSTYLNLGLGELAHIKLIVELADRTVKYPKGITKNVLVGIGKFVFPVEFIILDMPEDVKVPLILERTFLFTAYAKIDVFKRNITLRVGDEKIVFRSVKPASSLIKRVYMLRLRERMELDLEARLMGETLVRDQFNDLMPTIKEGDVIDEPIIDIIKTSNNECFDEYLGFCDFDRKIHIDCAYNLIFSCMIVVENMYGYRDQDMGDIVLGEPFCKASCVEARRFDRLITIHNGSDNVTYQMVQSHPSLGMVRRTHIQPSAHSLLKNAFQKFDVNLGSRSQMIETGILCLVTTSFRYSLANLSIGSVSFIGRKCADLVSRSTTTHMVSFPLWELGDKIHGDIVPLPLGNFRSPVE